MQADILVIGGGLAGTALAYYLARDGADVLLVEQHDLNMAASGANAGSIHAQIPHLPFLENGEAWARNFAPTIPLTLESIRMWAGLEAELGVDLEFSLPGGLLVAETSAQMRDIERKAIIEREHGLAVQLLDAADLRRMAPYLAPHLVGGALCPDEGKANPLAVTPAFARAALAHGARMLRRTRVDAVRTEAGGFAASTSRGIITARRVVNCAGADAGRVAAMVGLDLPIQGHPIQVSVTEPVAPHVRHLVYFAGEKLTLKQTRVGAFLIGGGWPARLDPETGRPQVDPANLRTNLQLALTVVPALRHVQLLRTWPAIVNGTDDWKPILGEVPRVPGFFMSMFPWLGFSNGPIAARTVADLVLGRQPAFDLVKFSAIRYLA